MPNYVERRSYLQMAKEKPEDIRREQECYRVLFRDFERPFVSVLETFGGAGILRRVLEEQKLIDERTEHEAWDFSSDCVEFLRREFPTSNIRQVDSFQEPISKRWELLSADFNSWTYLRYTDLPAYHDMTARLFESGARYIQLTDSAVNKMHLNHGAYAKRFKHEFYGPNYLQDYVNCLDIEFRRRFGYTLTRVTHHANASYLLFHAGREGIYPVTIQKVS